jgi:hypothetical protein
MKKLVEREQKDWRMEAISSLSVGVKREDKKSEEGMESRERSMMIEVASM